jgi:hypothetical protein
MSNIKEIKALHQDTRQKVMQLLGWNDLQYGEFQMKQAEAYLDYHIGADGWGIQQIRETPGFWAWWRNHWYKRDVSFVDEAKGLSLSERVLFYEISHDAEGIEFTPHHNVLYHSFQRSMIVVVSGAVLRKKGTYKYDGK